MLIDLRTRDTSQFRLRQQTKTVKPADNMRMSNTGMFISTQKIYLAIINLFCLSVKINI